MFQMIDPDSPECSAMVEDLISIVPVSDVMGELIRRYPKASIADVSLAYAKLLERVRESNIPFELSAEQKSYKAADSDPFVEHILNIG